MFLTFAAGLDLPRAVKPFLTNLEMELSLDDGMYHGNDSHYLSCGASALNAILSVLQLATLKKEPAAILDFGAGAGRVTRWLRAAFPSAVVDACDIREQDVNFCNRKFATNTWLSTTAVEELWAPQKYDLIWLGSVITHLPPEKTKALLEKMQTWTEPAGIVVFSFHGRYALERQNSGSFQYIHDEGWKTIVDGYQKDGYGYADYAPASGYGVSITRMSWFARLFEEMRFAEVVALSERAWDGHHDVLGFRSRSPRNS